MTALLLALFGFSSLLCGVASVVGSSRRNDPDDPGYDDLFEAMPIACHEIDLRGVIQRVNRAECALFEMEAADLLGKHCTEFVAPGEREASREAVREKLLGVGPLRTFQRDYLRRDGSPLRIEVHEDHIRDKQGGIRGIRTVFFDITERCQAQAALSAALSEAKAATEMKSRFLANMSHEIRTPMNGVLGMIQLLLLTPLTGEQRNHADAARHSAEALLTVINDILDLSKIEAGKLELDSIPFDLVAEVEEVASLLAVRAHAGNLELNCRIHPEVPSRLRGDPGRIRQVLTNLVGNAVKFTERGEIDISVDLVHADTGAVILKFSVTDSGIGIAPEVCARLFRSFEQGDTSTTRKYGGTGLGLAISRQLVEMMGGEIGVESEPGGGSTFWFTAVLKQRQGGDVFQSVPSVIPGAMRVLVVDDNATNRTIVRELLQAWGCRPQEAPDAVRGLQQLRQAALNGDRFQVALVDYQMPGMDGAALGQCIKLDPVLRDTGMVCLTSGVASGDIGRLREIGFSSILHKPLRQSHLYDTLLEALGPRSAVAAVPVPNLPELVMALRAPAAARILLAEDNDVNRHVAIGLLRTMGLHTDAVSTGRQAIRAVQEQRYDLILMDVQMPDMDGFEATAAIRRGLDASRSTPIVALTAHAMQGDREQCLAAGMDDYVSKPLQVTELQRVLSRWLPAAGVAVRE